MVLFEALNPFVFVNIFCYYVKDFYFVVCGDLVTGRTLLDLQGHKGVGVLHVLCQPHRRKLAPSQLLDDHVPVGQDLAQVDGVIATDLVLFDPFVLAVVIRISVSKKLR